MGTLKPANKADASHLPTVLVSFMLESNSPDELLLLLVQQKFCFENPCMEGAAW